MKAWEAFHTLVIGTTKSGKTTYVYLFCKMMIALGWTVIWYTTIPEQRLRDLTPYFTTSREQFFAWCFRSRRCIVVLDEGTDTVGRHDKDVEKIATQWRHLIKGPFGMFGEHCGIFMAQESSLINPVIRGCCEKVIAFRQSEASAELLTRSFTEKRLALAATLGKFEYLKFVRFEKLKIGRVPI